MAWQIVVAGCGDKVGLDEAAQILRKFLVPLAEAREGDIVVIGLPLAVQDEELICFDAAHPFPEVVVLRNGQLRQAMDDDIGMDCRAAVMASMSVLKADPMRAGIGVKAVRKYLEVAPAKVGHRGFMAWYYPDFVSATSWSEDLQLKVVIHEGDDADKTREAELEREMAEITARSAITRRMMQTLRR